MRKKIVISAVNLVEGGTLAVLQECLRYLSESLADKYEIIVLVNRKFLFNFQNLEFLEFPSAKKNWLNRVYYEYYFFNKLSKKLEPLLWFSFHDMTPNVKAIKRAVYCHNPSPFPPIEFNDIIWGGYKYILFKLFYRFLYSINIKENCFVILQQASLREKFSRITGYSLGNIIVAHPVVSLQGRVLLVTQKKEKVFFYPALPRVFKNFEVICKASKLLLEQGINNFQVIFTISGKENRYSRYIYNSYKDIKNIVFQGVCSREKVYQLYNESACVIFPSKLETWGMPITESKLFNKPILLADLDYAHETLGSYDKSKFFDPNNYKQLAGLMKCVIEENIVYEKIDEVTIDGLFARNWGELFEILLEDKSKFSLRPDALEQIVNV